MACFNHEHSVRTELFILTYFNTSVLRHRLEDALPTAVKFIMYNGINNDLLLYSIYIGLFSPSVNSVSDSESSLSRLVKSKKAEFTYVIEHFFDKRNADSGLYG